MIILEIIFAILSIIGLVLAQLHIPGGIAISTFSVLLLAFTHYLLGFALFNGVNFKNIFKRNFYNENDIKTGKIIAAVLAGWTFSVIEIGVLFKILHWPGGQVMLIVGLISTIFTGAFLLFQTKYRKNIFRNNIIRISILLVADIITLFI